MGKRRLSRDDWAEAARRALAEGGPSAVAVEPLAATLEATKGSFYWHFADRAALVTAALELWERRGTLDVIAALDRVADPRERLARLFDITFGMPDEGLVEAALAGHSGDPVVGPVLTRVAGLRVDYLRTLFAEMGLDAEECHARAALTYSAYVGWFQLARAVPEVTDGPAGAASRARLQAILLDLARPTSGQASTDDASTGDAFTDDAFTE